MKFSELLQYDAHRSPGAAGAIEAQRQARQRFPSVVREHGLTIGTSVRPSFGASPHVVIGVTPGFSSLDLALLDELIPALRASADEQIELFDIEEHPVEFEALVPGSASTGQTPAVIVWEGAKLVRAVAGGVAREFLRARYLSRP